MRLITSLKTIAAAGLITAASLFATTGAWAQDQNTGATTATNNTVASVFIEADITLTEDAAMTFGTVVTGTALGDCVLTAATGAVVCSGTNGPTGGAGSAAAAYTVTGVATATFSITAPVTGIVTTNAAAAGVIELTGPATSTPMIVNAFTLSPDADGVIGDSFQVGATLRVTADQQPGDYAGTFDVTVSYP